MDLKSDLVAILRSLITTMGYTIPTVSDDDVVGLYYNLLNRRVESRPRSIHKAQGFQCPSQHVAGLAALEQKLTQGSDVNAHLSRKITKADASDPLLDDWGITHLHLGTNPGKKGLIQGTKEVLFAVIRPDDIYFLCVEDHSQSIHFARQQMIQILHDNFPAIIQFAKGPVQQVQIVSTDADILELRTNHINAAITVSDGTTYGSIGGGQTASGLGLRAARGRNRWNALIRQLEKRLTDDHATDAQLHRDPITGEVFVMFKSAKGEITRGRLGLELPSW